MCIAIVYFSRFNVINLEINLAFVIKPFLYMTKKSRQKYIENDQTFSGKIKSSYIHCF